MLMAQQRKPEDLMFFRSKDLSGQGTQGPTLNPFLECIRPIMEQNFTKMRKLVQAWFFKVTLFLVRHRPQTIPIFKTLA